MLLEPRRARAVGQHERVRKVVGVGEDEVGCRNADGLTYLGGVGVEHDGKERRWRALPDECHLRADRPRGRPGERGLRRPLNEQQPADLPVRDLEPLLDDRHAWPKDVLRAPIVE